MRYAQIENGVVINCIEVIDPEEFPQFTLVQSETCAIGDTYDGATFTPPPPTVVVPQEVSMAQARLALLDAGLLTAVNAAIPSLGEAAQIEWDYRATVRRDNALVLAMKELLSWTDEQMDALFIAAGAK